MRSAASDPRHHRPPPYPPQRYDASGYPQPVTTSTGRRKSRPDPLLLGAIAGIATVLAVGVGTLMGLAVLLLLNPPSSRSQAAPEIPEVGIQAAGLPETAALERSAEAAGMPASVALETVAAPALPGRSRATGNPVTVMLHDLRFERELARTVAEPPANVLPVEPEPESTSVLSGLWSMVLRFFGLEREAPVPVPVPLPAPVPLDAVVRIEPAAAVQAPAAPPVPEARPAPPPPPAPVAAVVPAPAPSRPPRVVPEPPPRVAPEPAPSLPAPVVGGPIDLSDDDFDEDYLSEDFDEAELFIAPGAEIDEPAPTDEALEQLDALDLVLVSVRIDDGEDIPLTVVGVDGEHVVPGTLQLPRGSHEVQLYHRGVTSTFRRRSTSCGITQLEALDLAGGGLGQAVHNIDPAGIFPRPDRSLHMCFERLEQIISRLIRLQHDERLGFQEPIIVFHRHHGCLEHRLMGDQGRFHFKR